MVHVAVCEGYIFGGEHWFEADADVEAEVVFGDDDCGSFACD